MVYAIIIAYLTLAFLTSLIGIKEKDETPESYFLANRGVATIVLVFTLAATTFSAFFFLGFAGDGYRTGYPFYAFMSFGTAFAALSFYLIGNKAWHLGRKHGYITPVEMIGDMTKSKLLQAVYLIVMLVFTFPYIALQPIGAGYIMEELTDGQIPFIWGATGLTGFIIVYVIIGGMKSVAMTDVKQGALMIILMFAALIVIGNSLSGLTEANKLVFDIKPELFTHQGVDNYFSFKKWFSMNLLWMFCLPMLPHIFMRFFISKDLKGFKTSTIIYALIPSILFLIPVMIGVLGHIDFPGLVGKEADRILPMMLDKHSPEWFSALVMTGALAAFMSTLDSQLLSLSTIATRDVYLKYLKPTAGLEEQVKVGKIFVVVFALIGLILAVNPVDSLFVIGQQTFYGMAVLFPPTVAILYFKKTNPTACAIAIIIGEAMLVANFMQWLPTGWDMGFAPFFPIAILEVAIILMGSTIFPRQHENR